MRSGDYIGLDVGVKRTGLARASAIAKLAEPLKIIDTVNAVSELKNLINKYHLQAVVVGLPRNLNGEDTPQTRWVREWVENLKKQISLPVYFQDEALTSKLAKTQEVGEHNDDEAASIILQDFLNLDPSERVVVDDKE